MVMVYVAERTTGAVICACETIGEALDLIEEYEAEDLRNGEYSENFYDITDSDNCSMDVDWYADYREIMKEIAPYDEDEWGEVVVSSAIYEIEELACSIIKNEDDVYDIMFADLLKMCSKYLRKYGNGICR